MLQLHPMSVGDILDEAFSLYRSNFLRFLGITAVVQVPFSLLNLIVSLAMADFNRYIPKDWSAFLNPQDGQYPPGDAIFVILTIMALFMLLTFAVLIIQGLVGNLIAIGALNRAVSQRYHGREPGLRDAYNISLRRYWRVLGATLLQGCAFIAAFVPFGVLMCNPSINFFAFLGGLLVVAFLATRWSLSTPVAVLECAGPVDALRRSWRLTAGTFWRTFAVFLLSTILVWVLTAVPMYLIQFVMSPLYAIGLVLVLPIQNAAGLITQILVFPISIGILTLLYYDLRIRKEGYGMELLVQHVEETSRLAAPPAGSMLQPAS